MYRLWLIIIYIDICDLKYKLWKHSLDGIKEYLIHIYAIFLLKITINTTVNENEERSVESEDVHGVCIN